MTARFRLREILEDVEMTQTELSRRSRVSLVTINRMANNLTAQVSLKTLDALAKVLGVQPGDIIEGDEPAKRGRGK